MIFQTSGGFFYMTRETDKSPGVRFVIAELPAVDSTASGFMLAGSTDGNTAERHIKCGEEKPTCYKCLDARKKCRYQDLTVPYRPFVAKATSITTSSAASETSSASRSSLSQASRVSQVTDISHVSSASDRSKATEATALTSPSIVSRSENDSACQSLSQASSSISPQPALSNINNTRELDFYLRIIAPGLDPRRSELWNIMLPQAALRSPAVQNALVAMAGYYEYNMWTKQNLKMYSLAIQTLVQGDLLQVPAITRLFCCILFVAIEWMQGNLATSTELIRTGRRMILDYRKFEKTPTEQTVTSALESQFRTLELHFNSYTTSSRHIGWTVDRMPYYEFWRHEPVKMNFKTIDEGHESLSSMLHSFVLDRCHGTENMEQQHLNLHTDWYRQFCALPFPSTPEKRALEIVWLQNGLNKKIAKLEDERQYWDESFWDYYEFDYDLMVRLAESLDFTYEKPTVPRFSIGNNVTTHMLFVVHHCREPKIRRRAIEVIRRACGQSGMLKPDWMLKIAVRCVELEEFGRYVIAAPDIPTESRVIQIGLDWKPTDGTAVSVKYTFRGRIVVEMLT